MNLIKKLSSAAIVGTPGQIREILEKSGEEKVDLYTIVGFAMDTKTGSSQYGDWLAFRGKFEATNLITGEVSHSPLCFLPVVAEDLVLGELAGGSRAGEKSVGFAFSVGVRKPSGEEKAPTGYIYTVTPYSKPSEHDPLSELRAQLPKHLLPAPEKKKA